ncbi:hypothetical protein P153DRAFT_273087, partial [Dothidotthia symphoricarpi CBS 119687]
VSTSDDSLCGICFEPHTIMRQLKVCVHEFGEECLLQQLQSKFAWRYKCASCRRAML